MSDASTRLWAKNIYGPLQDKTLKNVLIKKLVDEYGYSDKDGYQAESGDSGQGHQHARIPAFVVVHFSQPQLYVTFLVYL